MGRPNERLFLGWFWRSGRLIHAGTCHVVTAQNVSKSEGSFPWGLSLVAVEGGPGLRGGQILPRGCSVRGTQTICHPMCSARVVSTWKVLPKYAFVPAFEREEAGSLV